ncbi:MAG: NAD(P)H-hydrate dehydratase [Chloroflexi bacterium]|nr:MAG: NAD(P)H-hydrate dehydratase [Chloroflexota bacterium]MBL1193543.1 NAD(P)H-hydrate dehydratase [Chloroflexota bacterium]NOH10834.1 NAD(P)H-hydrate dehydratase [Chloroflexota bacterium]
MSPKFVSVEEMIAIEKAADASGHSYAQMMEHAGRGMAEIILESYGQLADKSALALVGKGNNGGDALVALDHLNQAGWQTTALIVNGRGKDELVERLVGQSELLWTDKNDAEALGHLLSNHSVFVDGLLGTGIKLPLSGEASQLLAQVQRSLLLMEPTPKIVAVDCPSGMDCDTGEVAPETQRADLTVCMAAVKKGMLTLPAFEYLGQLRIASIGLPDGLGAYSEVQRFVVEGDWVREALPERPLDAHKGTFGKVMIIAGSRNYSGASLLAARAAFRSGSGWVMLAVPEPLQSGLAGHFPEATWIPLAHVDSAIAPAAIQEINENLGVAKSLLLGPGLGLATVTEAFVQELLSPDLPPMVIDADGLKLLARVDNWWEKLPADSVLTPHAGEMSILTGMDRASIQPNRLELAEQFASQWGHIVVLKGAFTAIAAPDGRTAIIPVASPALARAGTGDVLAGIIAGLRAQGMEAFEAAAAGAWLHGQAGLNAAQSVGSTAAVLAGDLVGELGPLLKKGSR